MGEIDKVAYPYPGDGAWGSGTPPWAEAPSWERDDGALGYAPSPWPAPPPATSHEVTIERERLRKIKEALPEAARPLDGVIQSIIGLTVAESTFTSFTYSLAIAYSEAEAFTLQELKSNVERIAETAEKVGISAANWAGAEHASTIKAV